MGIFLFERAFLSVQRALFYFPHHLYPLLPDVHLFYFLLELLCRKLRRRIAPHLPCDLRQQFVFFYLPHRAAVAVPAFSLLPADPDLIGFLVFFGAGFTEGAAGKGRGAAATDHLAVKEGGVAAMVPDVPGFILFFLPGEFLLHVIKDFPCNDRLVVVLQQEALEWLVFIRLLGEKVLRRTLLQHPVAGIDFIRKDVAHAVRRQRPAEPSDNLLFSKGIGNLRHGCAAKEQAVYFLYHHRILVGHQQAVLRVVTKDPVAADPVFPALKALPVCPFHVLGNGMALILRNGGEESHRFDSGRGHLWDLSSGGRAAD